MKNKFNLGEELHYADGMDKVVVTGYVEGIFSVPNTSKLVWTVAYDVSTRLFDDSRCDVRVEEHCLTRSYEEAEAQVEAYKELAETNKSGGNTLC